MIEENNLKGGSTNHTEEMLNNERQRVQMGERGLSQVLQDVVDQTLFTHSALFLAYHIAEPFQKIQVYFLFWDYNDGQILDRYMEFHPLQEGL